MRTRPERINKADTTSASPSNRGYHSLVIMRTDKHIIAELIRRITEVEKPLRIILFGSTARGDSHFHSDLDVLLVMPNGTNRRITAQNVYKNLIGFGRSVDVVVPTEEDLERYSDNFSLILHPALREGKEIYAA